MNRKINLVNSLDLGVFIVGRLSEDVYLMAELPFNGIG